MSKYVTYNEGETKLLGREFAKTLKSGAVIALSGDLGCGKTAFVKGVAEYFNITDDVTSPTYTLVNEYYGDISLFHFDVYRLENPSVEECDWMDEYFFGDGICLIEWAENVKNALPENTIYVNISKNISMGEDCREITIED